MLIKSVKGVPDFEIFEFNKKTSKYCICIPIINEGNKIIDQLKSSIENHIDKNYDIIICDGGSTDGSTEHNKLKNLNINTLLVKKGQGKQGAQLRMGFWWALKRGYEGIITVDGNNKDSMKSIDLFNKKLNEGYDFVQGSRYIKGGQAINTPFIRHIAVKLIHSPIISITAKHKFTDTTNAFRAYSKKYLSDPRVNPFRDIFITYELLAYLSVRASQLGYKVCEVPVTRRYPKNGKVPTKISFFKGNFDLIKILFKNLNGDFKP